MNLILIIFNKGIKKKEVHPKKPKESSFLIKANSQVSSRASSAAKN